MFLPAMRPRHPLNTRPIITSPLEKIHRVYKPLLRNMLAAHEKIIDPNTWLYRLYGDNSCKGSRVRRDRRAPANHEWGGRVCKKLLVTTESGAGCIHYLNYTSLTGNLQRKNDKCRCSCQPLSFSSGPD